MARSGLKHLLRDGCSPLYLPAWRGALNQELEVIIALEGRGESSAGCQINNRSSLRTPSCYPADA
jgi:hypothetical protein